MRDADSNTHSHARSIFVFRLFSPFEFGGRIDYKHSANKIVYIFYFYIIYF